MQIPGRLTVVLILYVLVWSVFVAPAQEAIAPGWQAKNRSEHQTEWSRVNYATNPATGRVRATTNSFIELATSLNRSDASGQWQPSSSAFQITATGAEANLAGHRVTLAGNINTAGAVQIERAGVKMQGHPLCIAYFDPVDGRSLRLADLTDANGWLVNSNEIVFSNCFDGISASIRYRNSIDGLESDLILHERPPVTPQDIGFSERTRLELFTEWIGDTPIPQVATRLLLPEKDADVRNQMVEPDFTDSTLTFGPLRMARGKAFAAGGTNAQPDAALGPDAVTVGKRFEIIDGRKTLIEAVEHRSVSSLLDKLPAAPLSGMLTNAALGIPIPEGEAFAAMRKRVEQTTDQSIRLLPARRLAHVRTDARIQTAANSNSKLETRNSELASADPPAFILDWQLTLTSGLTDYTLSSATNYLCAGTINFYGTTRIQGGTVVKFPPSPAAALLKFFGPVICDTDMHHPAYFVSKFDATVGEVMDGNTTPASYTGALELMTTGNKLKHLRVRNASVAVRGWDIDIRHSQFTACNTVFYMPESGAGSGPCRLGNVLVSNSGYIFSGTYYNVIATHLTVNNCYGALTSDPYDRSIAHFINSLLVNIDSMGVIPAPMLTASDVLASTPAKFQTVGGASHYLVTDSVYRGAGITTIDSTLLAELKQTTTYPPTILTGTLTASHTLGQNPVVIRNANGNPDKGYAYPAMDYLVRNLVFNGSAGTPANLLATNGVVFGFDPITSGSIGYGLTFGAYSQFVSVGAPDALNRFVLSHAIQESCPTVPNYFTLIHGTGLSPYPGAFVRFSDFSLSAGLCRHLAHWNGGFIQLAFQDSQIRGGTMYLGSDLLNHSVALTNTLVERVEFTYHPYSLGWFHARNNLFKGGQFFFDMTPPGGQPSRWTFYDNLFDGTTISQAGGPNVENNYNAYVTAQTTTRLTPAPVPSYDKTLTASPAYEAGALGNNYLPATATTLINQGSLLDAKDAGLFHYTTSTTVGSKEANTRVDIGLHYVAANAQNQAQDQDGDGRADYFEDRNGNGLYDSALGETDWQAMMYVVRNFAGIKQENESGTNPPDTMGAVGPSHFMVVLNGTASVGVYDKISGTRLSPSTTLKSFFTVTVSAGPYAGTYPSGNNNAFDPRITYDPVSQRWFACALEFGDRHVVLAVSRTSDPVGNGGPTWIDDNWVKYLVPIGGGSCFADFDTLGYDSNGIYISVACSQTTKVAAIPKAAILNGSAQTVQENFIFDLSDFGGAFGAFNIQPAVNFDPITVNGSAWFVFYYGGKIRYNHLKWVNGATGEPAWQMNPWGQLTINGSFYDFQFTSLSAPQRASATYTDRVRLDRPDSRLVNAVVRKIDGIQYLWSCHHIGVNRNGGHDPNGDPPNPADRSAAAWYKIQLEPAVSIVESESGRIYDSATTNPKFYYIPSLTVNKNGDMLIGFSGSSSGSASSDYISAYYTGRLKNGGMPTVPVRYFEGKDWFDNPVGPLITWGDYSYTSLDPDGVTIWTIQQYAESRYSAFFANAWGTRIAAIAPY